MMPTVKGKLRNKIFLMMVLVSVAPILIAGFLSVYDIAISHRVDVANLEGALIEGKYIEIRDFVDKAAGDSIFVTGYKQLGDIDPMAQKTLLKDLRSEHPEIKEATFIGLNGKETSRLNELHPDGVSGSELRDESQTEKFLRAKSGIYYRSPIYYTLAGPMLTIASPAKNQDGVIIAVSSVEIGLAKVQEFVSSARLGRTGYLYLVDEDGFLVASGFKDRTPPISANFKDIDAIKDVLGGKSFLGSDLLRRYENFFGENVVAAGKSLADLAPGSNLGLIAEWPAKEADASLNSLIYQNIWVSLIVFAAVVLVSIILATLIVKPIRKLERGTELVAEGKFDEVVDIKTGDELEELGAAFNKMMAGLKQLQQLKDEFVFIAAHELRTPVAAMKGYLSLILDGITGPITDKTKDFISKVMNANQRLIQLVNDLLEVSRSEAGRLTIKVSPIDVVEPIKSVLVELQSLADKQQVKLVYEPHAGTTRAMADPDRLKEVVVNLVGNSIKYMGDSGVVTISHEVQGNNLVTHIKDTGLGMSKDAQVKLFEKFYRVQTDKTKEIQGTGLGLFIVKEIIEKMNGKISAYSEGEGKGTTFSFTLPVA